MAQQSPEIQPPLLDEDFEWEDETEFDYADDDYDGGAEWDEDPYADLYDDEDPELDNHDPLLLGITLSEVAEIFIEGAEANEFTELRFARAELIRHSVQVDYIGNTGNDDRVDMPSGYHVIYQPSAAQPVANY